MVGTADSQLTLPFWFSFVSDFCGIARVNRPILFLSVGAAVSPGTMCH